MASFISPRFRGLTAVRAAAAGPQKLGYDIIGREGVPLSAKWGAADPRHGDAAWNGPSRTSPRRPPHG